MTLQSSAQSHLFRLVLFLSPLSLHAAETGGTPPPAPEGFQWQPIPELTDEFHGDKLDASKWLPTITFWKGREPSQFEPKNVSVADGLLRLRSTSMVKDLAGIKVPEKDNWVASAAVSSKESSASYGYYEARVKASRLSMTSSFWFQGKYSEIDVVEQLGAPVKKPDCSTLMQMNTHSFKNGWEKDAATPTSWPMPKGAADDFHIYGVWWKDKDTVWFYHNGTKVAEVKPKCEFLEPMRMFFDTEVFIWNGLPTIESLNDPAKNTMLVDWVRSWKLVKSNGPAS